jgi:hypothetical protein
MADLGYQGAWHGKLGGNNGCGKLGGSGCGKLVGKTCGKLAGYCCGKLAGNCCGKLACSGYGKLGGSDCGIPCHHLTNERGSHASAGFHVARALFLHQSSLSTCLMISQTYAT